MGLDRLIRNAVKTAKHATRSLQIEVTHTARTTLGDGTPVDGTTTVRKALVEHKQQRIVTIAGIERVSRAKVTFLEPVVIGLLDLLVLPDGSTGPILTVSSMPDPNGDAYLVEVYL